MTAIGVLDHEGAVLIAGIRPATGPQTQRRQVQILGTRRARAEIVARKSVAVAGCHYLRSDAS